MLDAIERRQLLKAPARLFSFEEEQVLAGWCLYKDLVNESSTSSNLKEFALSHFGRSIKASWLSKFLRRHQLSLKLVGTAKRSERDDSTFNTAVSFLQKIRYLTEECGVEPSRIKVFRSVFIFVLFCNFFIFLLFSLLSLLS